MLSKRFLFQFCLKCKNVPVLWSGKGTSLTPEYRLPSLVELESSAKNRLDIDFRIGWNEKGICFLLSVKGKKRPIWCRESQPEESDGLHLCIDTRDVRDVHRASRFCHRLVFLPHGGGKDRKKPLVFWLPIHRAKSHPNPVDIVQIRTLGEIESDGYRLHGMIPGEVLTGFDPSEFPRWGFHYMVSDQESGSQSLVSEAPFPHDHDPSLWPSLELL